MKDLFGTVFDETAKKRWRRIFKNRQKDAVSLGQHADEKIENLLIRRFDRLASVKRFVFLWVALFVLLIICGVAQYRGLSAHYQELRPAAGGVYNEGVVGTFTNGNPIYASGLTDLAVSRLVFSGLFKYDNNNNLVGDLAEKWELDAAQTSYKVTLKQNIRWHDGRVFDADDVVFTYRTIQNSEAQSPFYTTWRGIKVVKTDNHNVTFTLPNSLGAFPHSLTNGIIPAHILSDIPASEMRSAAFNSSPVGTGPFMWRSVTVSGNSPDERQQRISLVSYKKYWAGKPKLDSFSLVTFTSEAKLIEAFRSKQLNAMSGLTNIPQELRSDQTLNVKATPLTGAVMAFFNTSRPALASANVRKALVSSIDSRKVQSVLPYPVKKVDSPLLKGQLGYDESLAQAGYDFETAGKLLDQDGWVKTASGERAKDGVPLSVNLRSQNTQEYIKVAQLLQKEWGKLGVKVTPAYIASEDLQRNVISGHDYDILLYGISIGVDPDVFVYWHSSQAATSSAQLNLSEYRSAIADQALEGARTRADNELRAAKYKAFLAAWRQDSPALALYQPNFLYVTNGSVFGLDRKAYNAGADRFFNVHEWMVRQERQTVRQ